MSSTDPSNGTGSTDDDYTDDDNDSTTNTPFAYEPDASDIINGEDPEHQDRNHNNRAPDLSEIPPPPLPAQTRAGPQVIVAEHPSGKLALTDGRRNSWLASSIVISLEDAR